MDLGLGYTYGPSLGYTYGPSLGLTLGTYVGLVLTQLPRTFNGLISLNLLISPSQPTDMIDYPVGQGGLQA